MAYQGCDAAFYNIQKMQAQMEQCSFALDEAYTSLNTLIQGKVTLSTENMQKQNKISENMNLLMSFIMLFFGVIIALITLRTIIRPLKSAKR